MNGQSIKQYLTTSILCGGTSVDSAGEVLKTAFHLWSSVLESPLASPPQTLFPEGVKCESDITGVALSAAGELVPEGRWARTNMDSEFYQQFLCRYALSGENPRWRPFANVMLEAYWAFFGRNIAIAHRFLHPPRGQLKHPITHFDFFDASAPLEQSATEIRRVPLGLLTQILDPCEDEKQAFRKFFTVLLQLTSNVKEDVAIEEVIELAREVNRQATDHCFEYTLAMRAERARVELLRPESEELRKLLIEELAPEHVGHKDHSEGARTQQAVRCLQLLYLYRELAGDHLYVFSPPNTSSRACRLVATAWSREELEEDILKLLVTRYTDLSAVVNEVLSQTLPKVDDTSFQNKLKILKALTGEGVCATFMTKMDSFRSFADESARDTFWHLPEYLVLCERLAMRAVHEGESLSFRLFIGHGNVASQRLKFISRILTTDNKSVLDRSALHWAVNKPEDVESFSEAGLTSPCVLSLLLGNHSFLQDEEQRCVIHASPTGDLLNLCHLIGSTDPADVTDGGECILIMVEKNGDIKVFHPDRTSGSDLGRGRLLLWRRGGKWIVPEKYGHEYTDALTSAILTILGYSSADVQTHSALNVLTETAWNLSTHLKGASFVVIDSRRFSEEATPWQDTFAPMTQVFPFAEGRKLLTKTGSETLRQLAIQDGATIVDLADQRVFGRRHILVNYNVRDWLLKKVGESRARQETAGFLDTQGHHRILAWGTRHQSALAAALYLGADPDHNGCAKGNGCAGVVITVSSDGDIHVFGPDGMIPELAYPHAAQSNGKK